MKQFPVFLLLLNYVAFVFVCAKLCCSLMSNYAKFYGIFVKLKIFNTSLSLCCPLLSLSSQIKIMRFCLLFGQQCSLNNWASLIGEMENKRLLYHK